MTLTSFNTCSKLPHPTPERGSFPPVGSNYSKAMECLKARFGCEELVVQFYVRELLKLALVMNSKEGRVTHSSLYDRIETIKSSRNAGSGY